MNSTSCKIVALAALVALTSWASSNLAAAPPDTGQAEITALKAQVTQLQSRVDQLEGRFEEFLQPQIRPAK
jgi:TolA-binding protein